MKLGIVTKFVLSGLFMAGLAACSDKAPKKPSPRAVGLNTPLGKVLNRQHFCSEAAPDANNRVTLKRFEFQMSGMLVVTDMQLQSDGGMQATAEDDGHWGILNDQLFMMSDKVTMQSQVEAVTDTNAQQNCIKLTANSVSQQICPCDL